jgi:hypothetical protein
MSIDLAENNKRTKDASGSRCCASRLWKVEYMIIAILLLIIFKFSTRTLTLNVNEYLRCETKNQLPDRSDSSTIANWGTNLRTGGDMKSVETRRYARVLASIFSADIVDEARYRYAFRELLRLHPKVCSLYEFISIDQIQQGQCELIYTFVLGGNTDENAPTKIVSNTTTTSILATEIPSPQHSNDFHEKDIAFLNIK